MPRNASGNFTLPTGNPVISGTIIVAEWANTTLADIAAEITASLSREGEGGMLAPLKHAAGSALLPSVTFLNDIQSGLYLANAGQVVMSIAGAPVMRWTATGPEVPDGEGGWTTSGSKLFPGPDPTLADSDAAAIFGTSDPENEEHIAIGPTGIQAKNELGPATLNLNPLGGSVVVHGYYGERMRVETETLDLLCSNPGSAQPNTIDFLKGTGAHCGSIGYVGGDGTELRMSNALAGGLIRMGVRGQHIYDDVLKCFPDMVEVGSHGVEISKLRVTSEADVSETSARHGIDVVNGSKGLKMAADGLQTMASESAWNSVLNINKYGGSVQIGKPGDAAISVGNVDDQKIRIWSYGAEVARTVPAADGGLTVANGVTGSGARERVLTESDQAPSEVLTTYGRYLDPSDRGKLFLVTANAGLMLPGVDYFLSEDVGFTCFVQCTATGDCGLSTDGGSGPLIEMTIGGPGEDANPHVPAGHWAVLVLESLTHWRITIV